MSDPTLIRPQPRLDWSEEGPRAREAGDVYFSRQNGLEETRAVFLRGCGLEERFANARSVTIGELGFGTGLNFLAAWDLFRRTAPPEARLHFVSVEGYPLSAADARRALSAFPELAGLAQALVDGWPSPRKGAHRRVFEAGRVTLTVFHDEVLDALSNMELAADAWFLDGFAPAKNPQMWSEPVLREIAARSRPGARLATFTVAGLVRRGLKAAGFAPRKVPGYGRKRERLEAVFEATAPALAPSPYGRLAPERGPVAIIGAGIAAASLVHALGLRGRQAMVFAQGGLAAGASGAPSGLFTPRLEAGDRPHVRATLAAFDYARALYCEHDAFTGEGALRLSRDAASQERLSRLAGMLGKDFTFIDAETARDRTGLGEAGAGLWMDKAGRFAPRRLVEALFAGSEVRDSAVKRLERVGDMWQLFDGEGRRLAEASLVLLACGAGLEGFGALTGLEVEKTAGHVAVFRAGTRVPRAPVAWGHYASRTPGGDLLVGATHVKGSDPGPAGEAAGELEAALKEVFPALGTELGPVKETWSGVRAAFADRLPAAGPVPGPEFSGRWADYARGGAPPDDAGSALRPGLGVLAGFGARGFAHAPLLAEALVSDICADPSPLERAGRDVLHPARFALRALRRG